MAKFILKDAYIIVNSAVLSTRIKSISFDVAATAQEVTAMGDGAISKLAGIPEGKIDVEFYQDFAATAGINVDATLWPLIGADPFTVGCRAKSTARAVDNPEFSMPAIISSYKPLGGTVNSVAMAPVTFESAGALSRFTA
jgi:hypothetical protein